ncbi:MAG: hypothetical protein EXQ59_05260 [Acidobacteria bacterium]|nr:hypothetical protein [Acidobacteriota bacterium]
MAHPARSAVLAAGFGVGVAVMAILLGVAQIVLDQSRTPMLVGGGDVVIELGTFVPAQLLLSPSLQPDTVRSQIRVAAPVHTAALYMVRRSHVTRIRARGGIPSLERRLHDAETASIAAWRDSPADVAWMQDAPETVLRNIDRFGAVPDVPEWSASWAEWLYFNGRASNARFYLTFLVGSDRKDGLRSAGVRLQLDRGNGVETFNETTGITGGDALRAPDLTIGASSVRLEGMRYHIHVDLRDARGRRAKGDLTIDSAPGRLIPRLEFVGARGWRTGYVVPVMSGALNGTLDVDGSRVPFGEGTGYHDHNWGFWKGVSWQWGQAQHDDLSLVYGRVFPPPEAADPDRLPGFVGLIGPGGPLGYTTDVTITERNDANGRPQAILVVARGANIDLRTSFVVESSVMTRAGASGALASGLDFLQLRGTYVVTGRAGDRDVNFTAPGSAETFRGN